MDCMVNLKYLNINCIVEEEIEEDFYKNFIEKILLMNLEKINFIVKHDDDIDEPYSEDELKEIYILIFILIIMIKSLYKNIKIK